MPKRPRSHHLAAIAVSHVRILFEEAGFACDETNVDYGEDLVILPSLADLVDPFRIYVQVKGVGKTQAANFKDGKLILRLTKEHLLKWVRSPELVVVAVWLEKTDEIFYSIPVRVYTEWFLFKTRSKTIGVSFEKLLTETELSKIGWMARIGNFNRMILGSMSYTEDIDLEDTISETLDGILLGSKSERQAETMAIAASFLEVIGLMECSAKGVRLTECCLNRLEEMLREFGSTATKGLMEGGKEEVAATALILFHMYKIERISSIPGPLLGEAAHVLAGIVRLVVEEGSADHPDQGQRCSVCNQLI